MSRRFADMHKPINPPPFVSYFVYAILGGGLFLGAFTIIVNYLIK